MKKLWIIPLFVTLSLSAQDFESFKEEALLKSPYLQANKMALTQAQQESTITTRYKNPSLGLEASQFSQDGIASTQSGFRVEVTQPLRLWGIGNTREELANAQILNAQQSITLNKAAFIRDLSYRYLLYKRLTNLQTLTQEEYKISQKIVAISKARFESGTIAKVKYLQAKLDLKRINNNMQNIELLQTDAYYNLLAFAGLKTQREIQTQYSFSLHKPQEKPNSPELAYLDSQAKIAKANAQLNANKLEWIDLRAEFENEPDQDIIRVGVSVPLVVFNTKTQEKKIAQLQAQTKELLYEQKERANSFTLKKILRLVNKLDALEQSTKELYEIQHELLMMYEDGYKIANINLIELQLIKNQMISTKEKLIELQIQKERNIVQYNYITGAYNE